MAKVLLFHLPTCSHQAKVEVMFAHSRIQIDYGFVRTGSEWGVNGITIGNKNRGRKEEERNSIERKMETKVGEKVSCEVIFTASKQKG